MEVKFKSWKVVKDPEQDKYELRRKVLMTEEAEDVYLNRKKKKTDPTAMESADVR